MLMFGARPRDATIADHDERCKLWHADGLCCCGPTLTRRTRRSLRESAVRLAKAGYVGKIARVLATEPVPDMAPEEPYAQLLLAVFGCTLQALRRPAGSPRLIDEPQGLMCTSRAP